MLAPVTYRSRPGMTATGPKAGDHQCDARITARRAEELYRLILTARWLDRLELELVNRGEGFFHVGGAGHEATATLAAHLTPADWLHLHYRDKALMLARGIPLVQFFHSLLCTAASHSAGRQMSAHLSAPALHVLSLVGPVGNNALQAVGVAHELASLWWRSDGGWTAPVVILAPCGGYRPGLGPFHAQTFEGTFAHVPGLDVVMPGTAEDAAGLLAGALAGGRPTLFLYPKVLLNDAAVAGFTMGELDWIVPHQANGRIIAAAQQRSGVPAERLVSNVGRYGNTSSSSIPIALAEMCAAGKKGRTGLAAFGGGFTFAAAVADLR